MATYFGSSEHGLDDKGRMTLPARILDELPKNQWRFHLTAGLDRCLLLHDSEGFQELVAQIGRAVPGSRAHRALCRRFLGHSEAVVPDGNRRIRVPEPLLKYAGLAAKPARRPDRHRPGDRTLVASQPGRRARRSGSRGRVALCQLGRSCHTIDARRIRSDGARLGGRLRAGSWEATWCRRVLAPVGQGARSATAVGWSRDVEA